MIHKKCKLKEERWLDLLKIILNVNRNNGSIWYSVFAIRLFGIRYSVFVFADIHNIRYSSFLTILRPLVLRRILSLFQSYFLGSFPLSLPIFSSFLPLNFSAGFKFLSPSLAFSFPSILSLIEQYQPLVLNTTVV